MCAPQRSDSGYRLYSDRDIAKIRWLKAQVDAGMAISQAVSWMERLTLEAGDDGHVILPFAGEAITPAAPALVMGSRVRGCSSLQEELLTSLLNYDDKAAETVLAEAFALYSVEQVSEEVVVPMLVRIGEMWHAGEISVTTEHFASNYLMQRLTALLRTSNNIVGGPVIWVGCAPGESHEIGALLLTIFLRRNGYNVQYLGRNLPVEDLVAEIQRKHPAMILISAGGLETSRTLETMTFALANVQPPRPIIGYGGRIFNEVPEMRNKIAGVYLGGTAQEAIGMIDELLRKNTHTNRS